MFLKFNLGFYHLFTNIMSCRFFLADMNSRLELFVFLFAKMLFDMSCCLLLVRIGLASPTGHT